MAPSRHSPLLSALGATCHHLDARSLGFDANGSSRVRTDAHDNQPNVRKSGLDCQFATAHHLPRPLRLNPVNPYFVGDKNSYVYNDFGEIQNVLT